MQQQQNQHQRYHWVKNKRNKKIKQQKEEVVIIVIVEVKIEVEAVVPVKKVVLEVIIEAVGILYTREHVKDRKKPNITKIIKKNY